MGVRWTANPFRFGDYGVNMVKTRSLETRKLGLDGGLRSHRVPFKFQKVHIKNSRCSFPQTGGSLAPHVPLVAGFHYIV